MENAKWKMQNANANKRITMKMENAKKKKTPEWTKSANDDEGDLRRK